MSLVLIIEDEKKMALGIKDNLEYDGFDVLIAEDGETGLRMALEERPDLIILDIMLPRKSGFDVCRELRAQGASTPIIMLTARGQEIDKVLGLELGADDYMTKPFSVRELLARVKAVMRRYAPEKHPEEGKSHKLGKLTVDFEHYVAKQGETEIKLSHKEFEILKYFHQHSDQAIHRDELIQRVWGYDAYPTSRTVDNHIVKLRKKVEPDPAHPKHILTVHGIGYKFIP